MFSGGRSSLFSSIYNRLRRSQKYNNVSLT
nr:MAG TPA: hypothetical protein [Caudoviricetes sp.]